MNASSLSTAPVLVVGAGIMGAGIAQVAAQAGHRVFLHDARAGAAAEAKARLQASLSALVAKGKMDPALAEQALARIEPVAGLAEASSAQLVVEAIVENLQAKRSLFAELEALVAEDTVLATNTSSISVTAIANGLKHPQRLVGMHFFNPVPLMKLVEVVSGLQTDCAVAEAIFSLSKAWGKVPVHATSTPGFIVNRIARPYYAETLALLLERAATPQALDACLRAAGFRMGPCELMDLIGHDTNFAVTNSVFEANFQDKRFVPSLVQREMVAGGLLGRKSGRGFYAYPQGVPALAAATQASPAPAREVVVHGGCAVADWLEQALPGALAVAGTTWPAAARLARVRDSNWTGLAIDGARLVLTDGRPARAVAQALGTRDVAVFDRPLALPAPQGSGSGSGSGAAAGPIPGTAPGHALAYALAYAPAPQASPDWSAQAPAWLAALGFTPLPLADAPGLVVARTVAMLVNEAADAVLQGVCSPEGADAAMKLGVNYPAGPFEWLARWSVAGVVGVLEALDVEYRGERYRVSPWLLRKLAGTLPG